MQRGRDEHEALQDEAVAAEGEDPRLLEPTDNSTGAVPDLDRVEDLETQRRERS